MDNDVALASSQECSLCGGRMPNKNSDWKLQFDPEKSVAILPPKGVETVNRMIGQGPNSQQIEHCFFASTIEELLRRSPIFYIRVPTSNKGETRDWPMGDWP
ncbi:MAG: hypothetical protein K9L31_01575, partial [Candidatus Pacebacteria bacterium]|nr:hypothetical protein [Candidatus Paceibacterota bacterium]